MAAERVEGLATFQTSAVTLCFSRAGRFGNRDVDSAFVAKYEINLDECLA